MKKELFKGNEAIGKAAVLAGCRHYFCYPITPQSELPEFLAKEFPKIGGVFLQAESEVAAINMVYGAASAGVRTMTSSSSPGISLKQEGLSYLAGAELPCVIVNIMRGGPGLGNIAPEQGDYFQATKGGGHGNYRLIVLAPNSAQEMCDLTILAFDLADRYRNPVMILGDGSLGQMMEPVSFPEPVRDIPKKEWATTGCFNRERNIVSSIYIDPLVLEQHNFKLERKYNEVKKRETRCEKYMTDDADVIIVAYGIVSRVAKSAIEEGRKQGIRMGLLRPITLFPFPEKVISELAEHAQAFLAAELSTGQMVEDVRLAVNGKKGVYFIGRCGGVIMSHEEILEKVKSILNEIKKGVH